MKYIEKTIERNHNKNSSIVSKILETTRNPKLAAVLALDLFLVGVDTVKNSSTHVHDMSKAIFFYVKTSIAVASTLYQLAENQDKQEKLYQELERALPRPEDNVTVTRQEALPYLKACIKETLRYA